MYALLGLIQIKIGVFALLATALFSSGCGQSISADDDFESRQDEENTEVAAPEEVEEAPPEKLAEYHGTLPAASAEGIEYNVTFYDDGSFYLHRIYLGRPERLGNVFEEEGPYIIETGFDGDSEAERYILHPKDAFNKTIFLKIDDETLLMLDREGKVIDSDHNYALKRVSP